MDEADEFALGGVILNGLAVLFALILVFVVPSAMGDPSTALAATLSVGFLVAACWGIGVYLSAKGLIKEQTTCPIVSHCISLGLLITFLILVSIFIF